MALRTVCEALARAACRLLKLEQGEILAEPAQQHTFLNEVASRMTAGVLSLPFEEQLTPEEVDRLLAGKAD